MQPTDASNVAFKLANSLWRKRRHSIPGSEQFQDSNAFSEREKKNIEWFIFANYEIISISMRYYYCVTRWSWKFNFSSIIIKRKIASEKRTFSPLFMRTWFAAKKCLKYGLFTTRRMMEFKILKRVVVDSVYRELLVKMSVLKWGWLCWLSSYKNEKWNSVSLLRPEGKFFEKSTERFGMIIFLGVSRGFYC